MNRSEALRLEFFARYLFAEYCRARLDGCLPTDCTMHLWADLDHQQKEVWRRMARYARMYLARTTLPSKN